MLAPCLICAIQTNMETPAYERRSNGRAFLILVIWQSRTRVMVRKKGPRHRCVQRGDLIEPRAVVKDYQKRCGNISNLLPGAGALCLSRTSDPPIASR